MSDNKPKIGVVGAGHLGRHHIKHLSQHSGVEFVGVVLGLNLICCDFPESFVIIHSSYAF